MPSTGRPAGHLSVRGDHRNGVGRLLPTGELDLATVSIFERALAAAEEVCHRAIVLDLTSLSFMDSTGLHSLLRAHQRGAESGRAVVVVGAGASILKLLELARVSHLVDAARRPDMVELISGEEPWVPLSIPEGERE